ncbi:DUF1963 domain-containing protein [Couchioplanes caeruleus]|uniref:DUF1963 domain-containing protein n=1 Tax=Couchioplanes caeruleus TaxID=56438 RepID=UPI0020C103E0|nr:DUF1963 domain-containing protein [Couchioplanes caeruleus]UQU64736.1 DUF1963 domain-containing protein [Couchioplanes caeruleus]
MNHRERFLRAAAELGVPADEATAFAGFLRFAIWTSPHYTGPVVGQRGGLPRLPADMPWPSSGSLPLPFIASFDCAALPRVDDLPLPADGSLLLFLDHDMALEEREENDNDSEMEYARVVYVPVGTPTVTAPEPDHSGQPFYNTTLSFIGDERPLIAEVNAELPSWLRRADMATPTAPGSDDHLGLRLPHREELRVLAGKLWPESNGASVRLGGYTGGIGALATDHMYATPETEMAEKNLEARKRAGELVIRPGERDAYLERETLRVMREWLPLAQFVPDEVHRGRFLIRRDHLAAGRFDEALSFTAFTE